MVDGTDETAVPPAAQLLLGRPELAARVRHVEILPARAGQSADWPEWADPAVVAAWRTVGVDRPWTHQVAAADAAWHGRSVAISTGTASGKSLAYLLPVLTALRGGRRTAGGRGTTALYIAPTKALAADQYSTIRSLGDLGVLAATYDGDTPTDERRWIRDHATLVLTNPDMLHHVMLPGHTRWHRFLRGLRYVVVDECHHYRGVFGSHVASVLRRLRRLCEHHGGDPVFVLASATAADQAGTARRLLAVDVDEVTEDASPRGRTTFLLWEPGPVPQAGEPCPEPDDHLEGGTGDRGGANARRTGRGRRTALAETADLLAELVAHGVPTLAFVPSRRGAEVVAADARRRLDRAGQAADRIASYRGGYLPEDRRALEAALRSGALLGLATTNALELGVDVSGLDAVLICGWPGRLASLWQQAGRAGRRDREALAVLVARDDPLDTFLLDHPAAVFDRPVEATVLDPENPYVLAPHLCAAAAELPLHPQDLPLFGPGAAELVEVLVHRGALRARPSGWYWTRQSRPTDLAELRGTGEEAVRVVEAATGRLLGTVDGPASHHAVHPGAVYLHQGGPYLVRSLELDDHLALVEPTDGAVFTQTREVVGIHVLGVRQETRWGQVGLALGNVEVTSQVVSFLRRDTGSGTVLGEEPLDLPERTLRTTAVWWTVPEEVLLAHGVPPRSVPGAAHAAEHAAIGLLPLVASCDRWDVGGVSTSLHQDTGCPTVFVHDASPGGAGFAQRGFHLAATWFRETRDAVRSCGCEAGCPSCVHSPKCGNGNEPLDKPAAIRFLDAVLADAPAETPSVASAG